MIPAKPEARMKKSSALVMALLSVSLWISGAHSPVKEASRLHVRLDEDSTVSLTIQLRDDGLRLDWRRSLGVPYWAVLRSSSVSMAPAETLAVTSDTFWVDSPAVFPATRAFFQVLPLPWQPPSDTARIIEDFESGSLTLQSIAGEDNEPANWAVISSDSYNGSGHCLRLYGNTWKKEPIDPVSVESNTVWQVAMKLVRKGEIQAIGVADSVNWMRYIIWGSECPQAQVWLTTYQGWFGQDTWIPLYLPIGEDWQGRFGYLPRIRELHFVNDNDNTSPRGEVRFDEIRDVTGVLPYPPVADFRWTIISGAPPESVRVQFNSLSYDLDSPLLTQRWDFGDGLLSMLAHPQHDYLAHGRYTVTLTVTDDSNNVAWRSAAVTDSPVTQTRELWMAFSGDIMIGRGYENPGGIISTYGVDTIFSPTRSLIAPLDLASCNLECPLTTATTAHPTKGIVLKTHPENVAGITDAGFDFAALANNHIFDYLEAGLYQTLSVLDSAGVAHTGAGANDLLARRTCFLSRNGLSLAMLAFSDRTGSYNNVQPFLDAARSRPGFAMWNRSAIEATIPEASALADFVVLNVHSGSEYQYQPQLLAGLDVETLDEDLLLSVVPDTSERLVRKYAIDNGADLVITHHPHIIQGFEVYHGKLIAHSLGNFVFDLTMAETLPSLIVQVHFSTENGIDTAVVHPVYLDHWIPRPALGGLGRAILNYESEMSRRLDTWLVRSPDSGSARIVWDTTAAVRTGAEWTDTLQLTSSGGWWISQPWKMREDGYPVRVEVTGLSGAEVRVGRDLLWFGGMEDEGARPWNLNSSDEGYVTDVSHLGERSIRLRRATGAGDNVVTQLELRKPLDRTLAHSMVGWIQTQNATDAAIQAQFYSQRSGGSLLGQVDAGGTLDGDQPWTYMSSDLTIPGNTAFVDVRLSLYPPSSDTGYAWFDDLALVQWGDWQSAPASVPFPSDFTFLQVRTSSSETVAIVRYRREWVQ
jgi:poly-gamma-glutamate capsule biosynthesis protein CapA/YwtB (metallophosphatase superfamily)